jgi:hypothetical protein
MTIGWQAVGGEFHYFAGQQGKCGQWQAICMTAEAQDVNGGPEPTGYRCAGCWQMVKHLNEIELLVKKD